MAASVIYQVYLYVPMEDGPRYVVDTSVVVERSVCDLIVKGKISGTLLIPRAVYAELEHQANQGQEIGFLGLAELEKLQELVKSGNIALKIVGERPLDIQIKHAKTGGEIDAMIARVAYDEDATLVTADKVQASSSRAAGVAVMYLSLRGKATALLLEKYFDEHTMSAHLKEGCVPQAKRGVPGGWSLVAVGAKKLTHLDLEKMTQEIIEKSRVDPSAFIEIARPGSTIVQYQSYRIVITRPPVSDGLEITAVKPIKQLSLDDYNLPETIKKRLEKQARGILVAGETGSGKCLDVSTPVYSFEQGKLSLAELLTDSRKEGTSYVPRKDIQLLSLDPDGKLVSDKIKKILVREEDHICTVSTRAGKEIRTTDEHPFLVFRPEAGICWLPLHEIKQGDLIATPEQLEILGRPVSFDLLQELDEDLFYALCDVSLTVPAYMKYALPTGERKIVEFLIAQNLFEFRLEDLSKLYSKSRARAILTQLMKDKIVRRKQKGIYCLENKQILLQGKYWLSFKDLKSSPLKHKITRDQIIALNTIGKNMNKSLPILPVWQSSVALMKILAYLNSEGISKFGISNTSPEILEDFFSSVKEVLGVDFSAFKVLNNSYYIDSCNTLHHFFKKILNYDAHQHRKSFHISFPQFFFLLSQEEKVAYLKAYFDAESHVDAKSIELVSASKKHLQEMSLLLLGLAIHSRIKKKMSQATNSPNPQLRTYWRLTISGANNLQVYQEKISFSLTYKRERLNSIIKDNPVTNVGALPLQEIFKSLKQKLRRVDFHLYYHSKCSKQQLHKIYEKLYDSYSDQMQHSRRLLKLVQKLSCISEWQRQLSSFEKHLQQQNLTIGKFSQTKPFDRASLTNWVTATSEPRVRSLCKLADHSNVFSLQPYRYMDTLSDEINTVCKAFQINSTHIAKENPLSANAIRSLRNRDLLGAKPSTLTAIKEVLLDRLKELQSCENELAQLHLLKSSQIFWDEVSSITTRKGNFQVFDIEMEHHHNFVAGETPFVVHNSTFSQALAEFYASSGFITKTVESPRDLILSPSITQYSKNFADSEEIHDILFLSRPDYIIFDEVRDTPDFTLYVDLRLGGSNVLGVLHAATAIDAINRFIARLDTGTIPSVLDTILFIEKGNIGSVLTLEMTVKVPSGMTEADLARPVVVVHDFLSNKAVYEIYSYGEQTVVIPISQTTSQENPSLRLAARQLEKDLLDYVSDASVKMVSDRKAEVYVPSDEIARLIGKAGSNITRLEKQFGLSLDVKELAQRSGSADLKPVRYSVKETSKYITLVASKKHGGKTCDVYVDDHFLFTSTLSKKGEVKVHKKSKLGHVLVSDFDAGKNVDVRC